VTSSPDAMLRAVQQALVAGDIAGAREIADHMTRENMNGALRAGLLVEAHRQAQHRKAAAAGR
jgi:hypothetical protein